MQIQFQGAAQTTTGSMHLLDLWPETSGPTTNSPPKPQILLDCGLFQGHRNETYEKNLNFPFDPGSIATLLLSHAHIDHCGNIPNLVKKGFGGNVYCTSATQDLCSFLLRDSAHIQQKDIEYLNKRRARKKLPPAEPLYTMEDAEKALFHFHGIYYHRPFQLFQNATVTFYDAGHILGSALTAIDVRNEKRTHRILYTGDLGRKDMPILRDPEIPSDVNTLIIESTYGNRRHGDILKTEKKLEKIINSVAERKGKIIVPSFSVGRTQELVYCIHRLLDKGKIPGLPVFVDSPLSANVTEIFREHYECYDAETRDIFLRGEDPFGFSDLTYIRAVEKSKRLNHFEEPCIIISASGMCEAGRILHHLKNNIEDPRNMVLIVGFMAANTLGRRIVEREPRVRIFGEPYSLRAEVEVMNEFSAHADADDLVEYVNLINETGSLKQVFIVHGEKSQSEALASRLRQGGNYEVQVPRRGEIFQIRENLD